MLGLRTCRLGECHGHSLSLRSRDLVGLSKEAEQKKLALGIRGTPKETSRDDLGAKPTKVSWCTEG